MKDLYKNKSDEELVNEASQIDTSDMNNSKTDTMFVFTGAKEGRGASAELLRRLKNSIQDLSNTTSFYSKWLIILTIAITFMTFILLLKK